MWQTVISGKQTVLPIMSCTNPGLWLATHRLRPASHTVRRPAIGPACARRWRNSWPSLLPRRLTAAFIHNTFAGGTSDGGVAGVVARVGQGVTSTKFLSRTTRGLVSTPCGHVKTSRCNTRFRVSSFKNLDFIARDCLSVYQIVVMSCSGDFSFAKELVRGFNVSSR